ncbi:MAG: ribose 5-phosphate isomerase B [Candidatus Omnitrophica bacterium]|nr:ribose 5-phosphate isomerase B [Candidatus Omnitrophota bacterium]
MKIAIGADHGGYKLKSKLIKYLERHGHVIADLGTHSVQSCDYPAIGYKVASSVSLGVFPRGILICKTGIGFSMVANKLPGVRAGLCMTIQQARRSREHNNANVLCLAGSYLSLKKAQAIVKVWLKTEFAGGRHARRVRQITNIERRIYQDKNVKFKNKNSKPKRKIQNQ